MLIAENIFKSYESPRGKQCVLSGFSCEIEDKSFFGISGKSGAGKSTLLSILAGLLEPDSGKVIAGNTDIFSLNDRDRALFRNRKIGYVSQELSFLSSFTVYDNVRLPFFLGEKKDVALAEKRVEQLLSQLGIAHLADCFPDELSGGENHRLLIARALVNNPDYIFADEPTASLDREQADDVLGIFRELCDKGKTIVMVSHDERALSSCDKVVRL